MSNIQCLLIHQILEVSLELKNKFKHIITSKATVLNNHYLNHTYNCYNFAYLPDVAELVDGGPK